MVGAILGSRLQPQPHYASGRHPHHPNYPIGAFHPLSQLARPHTRLDKWVKWELHHRLSRALGLAQTRAKLFGMMLKPFPLPAARQVYQGARLS